jgi:hypothetical protein
MPDQRLFQPVGLRQVLSRSLSYSHCLPVSGREYCAAAYFRNVSQNNSALNGFAYRTIVHCTLNDRLPPEQDTVRLNYPVGEQLSQECVSQ